MEDVLIWKLFKSIWT